ncbi:hypothetical protein YPPY66_1948, partial [Yersinia pestis PY-66]
MMVSCSDNQSNSILFNHG